jgi:hypothetical protein
LYSLEGVSGEAVSFTHNALLYVASYKLYSSNCQISLFKHCWQTRNRTSK